MTPYLNLEYIFQKVYDFFTGEGGGFFGSIRNYDYAPIMAYSYLVAYLGIFFFVLVVIFFGIRLYNLHKREKLKFISMFASGAIEDIKNERWREVEAHIGRDNPSDWRVAILEADTMLDELLDVLGYEGEGIGDKLKQIQRADFRSLDDAWEAHKVRNALAHEGTAYQLSEREARRVIELYSRVFEEFKYI